MEDTVMETRDLFNRVSLTTTRDETRLRWVLPGLLQHTVGLIVGAGGIGKSFLALQLAADLATGCATLPGLFGPQVLADDQLTWGGLRVAGVFAEDPEPILAERLQAWFRRAAVMPGADPRLIEKHLDHNLFLTTASRPPIWWDVSGRQVLRPGPAYDELTRLAQVHDLLILDPLSLFHTGDENDNMAMTLVMNHFNEVARQYQCTIILLHHIAKSSRGSQDSRDVGRGAVAITNRTRWVWWLREPGEGQQTGTKKRKPQIPSDVWLQLVPQKINYPGMGVVGQQWLQRLKDRGGVLACVDNPLTEPKKPRPAPTLSSRTGTKGVKQNSGKRSGRKQDPKKQDTTTEADADR